MSFLSDQIVFEAPSCGAARTLHLQLALEAPTRRDVVADTWFVAVEMDTVRDLAHLLRRVERWIAHSGLGAIRYHLDGNSYILAAGEIRWSQIPEARETPVGGAER